MGQPGHRHFRAPPAHFDAVQADTSPTKPRTLARVNPWSLGTASSGGASPPLAARSRSLFFLMRSAALAQCDSMCSRTASSSGSAAPAGLEWCC